MAAGKKTGGRVKGVPNKAQAARVAAIAATGETPLEFLTRTYQMPMPDTLTPQEWLGQYNLRQDAAKAAAPYVHAKLASIEIGNKDGEAFKVTLLGDDGGLL